jgi:hypothetical protein
MFQEMNNAMGTAFRADDKLSSDRRLIDVLVVVLVRAAYRSTPI